jgi:hypothetical protein
VKSDILVDGLYADDYKDDSIKKEILKTYQQRYKETPATHPEKYSPLEPPQGWRYDPYYECWVKL